MGFGAGGEGYVRLCYTREPSQVVEAMDKLKEVMGKFHE